MESAFIAIHVNYTEWLTFVIPSQCALTRFQSNWRVVGRKCIHEPKLPPPHPRSWIGMQINFNWVYPWHGSVNGLVNWYPDEFAEETESQLNTWTKRRQRGHELTDKPTGIIKAVANFHCNSCWALLFKGIIVTCLPRPVWMVGWLTKCYYH